MESNSTRRWPWAGALLALLVGALPMLAVLVLETPGQWTGSNAHRYREYRAFWGGNPDEVFSHWLNMVVLSWNRVTDGRGGATSSSPISAAW